MEAVLNDDASQMGEVLDEDSSRRVEEQGVG